VQRDQFRADNIADFFRRHFGIAGAGTVKQTDIHNVNFSMLNVSFQAVYQNHAAIRHNAAIE